MNGATVVENIAKRFETVEIGKLPLFLKPVSSVLPLTYGTDVLNGAVHGGHTLPFSLDPVILGPFCVGLFAVSLHKIRGRWVA